MESDEDYVKMKNMAYKLFRVKQSQKGQLFPLYVLADEPTPMHIWLPAKEGERLPNGKVKSRMGGLAFRAGWHCSELPYATHIGVKDDEGIITMQHPDTVWCVIRYSDSINYDTVCRERSENMHNGKFVERDACMEHVPENGFYHYRTNPQMFGRWIIAGAIIIECVLSDGEVDKILKLNGIKPMPRSGGKMDLKKYGF